MTENRRNQRREKLRDMTRQEIKDTARQLMVEKGTAGLSIRAIARQMEMTAPALYHYYNNLDDLVTALIADNFHALADVLEIARDRTEGSFTDKLMAVLLAYRQWAIENPVDFQLIYGNPIPGYEAPREITVPASARSLIVIVGLLEEAIQHNECVPPKNHVQVSQPFQAHLKAVIEATKAPEIANPSPISLYLATVGWGQVHGLIMLELFGHIEPVVGDIAAFYRVQMEQLIQSIGFRR